MSGRSSLVEETHLLPDTRGLGPWSIVEQLVRTLRAPVGDPDDLLGRICTSGVRLVRLARDAGVIITSPDRNLATVCATGPAPRQLDELQMKLGTGPCLTAARKQIVVRMHDVAADTRWAEFRAAALTCDVASMLCVPLSVDDQVLGTLSFYGDRPDCFRDDAEPIARTLAALSAVALAESQQRARMERALRNRDVIGQAKGILMHRHGVTADVAFEMLRAHSQRTNSKLLAVAEGVVEAGALG
jgi:GAF domain-containing protein